MSKRENNCPICEIARELHNKDKCVPCTNKDLLEEIKRLKLRIEKKDSLLKTILEDFRNLRIGIIEGNDPEINHTIQLINKSVSSKCE